MDRPYKFNSRCWGFLLGKYVGDIFMNLLLVRKASALATVKIPSVISHPVEADILY